MIPLCDAFMSWVQRLFADFGVGLNGGCLATSSIRILVVDDFEPWRHHVWSMLQTSPELRVVAQGADGLEAVRKAQELKPDLILLDIGLPNLDGLEAANQIRQIVPDAKIIFLTQNSDREVVRAALSTGARGYVHKQNASTELLPAVGAVLRGQGFVSRELAATSKHSL